MRSVVTAVAVGIYLAVAAGAAMGSGDGKQDEGSDKHAGQSESRIYGTIQSLPEKAAGTWKVNGREVRVTETTVIKQKHGRAEVGAYVEVEGHRSGNALNAYKIEVKRGSREVPKPGERVKR